MIDRRTNFIRNIDWVTVFIYLLLVIMGWINIYAAVYNEQHKSIFELSQRYGSQMVLILTAFVLAFVIFMIDLKFYTFFAYPIYGLSLLLLVLVLVMGREINGARAWLFIGKFSIQPAEFAKVATALAIAKYLSAYNIKVTSLRALLSVGMLIFLPMFLIILQPDAGSLLVFFSFSIMLFREGLPGGVLIFGFVLAVLFFVSLVIIKLYIIAAIVLIGYLAFVLYTRKYKETLMGFSLNAILFFLIWGILKIAHKHIDFYYVIAGSFFLSGLVFLTLTFFRKIRYVAAFVVFLFSAVFFAYSVEYMYHHILHEHQRDRMDILLGLKQDPLGMGYNVNQSMIAIGSGGFVGKGFLQGTQTKYNFVPEQSTDFIFCTVGEEWGFIGTSVVIGLFMFLLIRVVFISERQRSTFSRVYGYSVASILFFHFAINVGMTIGVLPVIGIPLPFFSYGGSSLWAFTILLFVLIRLDASRMELLK
jgi:rod shape determining protein RodA